MFCFAIYSFARLCACLFAALSLLSWAAAAQAQTIYDWNDPAGGGYTDALNWTPLGVPNDVTESARFALAGAFDVTLGSGSTTTVSDLLVSDGDVTLASSAAVFATYVTGDDVAISGGSVLKLSSTGGNGDVRLTAGDDLTVNTGGTLAVELGSQMTTSDLILGTSGLGATSLIGVDGSGSHFSRTNTTPIVIGQNGATAELLFRDGATGDINGTLTLTSSGNDATAAFLDVESEADLELDSLVIGASAASNVAQGRVWVTGSGATITQTGASTLTIGTAAGNIGNLTVDAGAVFHTGTGATTVNATGSIDIGGGTFNANGDVNVNGGSITRSSIGSFNLAAGRTLTASNDAQINLGTATTLSGGTTWEINDGADLFTTGGTSVGLTGGLTNVTVDGTGSSLGSSTLVTSSWGQNGASAHVTLRNGASANVGGINLANSNAAGTTGILAVESQATMNTTHIYVALSGGATTSGTITVSNATLTQIGISTLTLGHATSGTATINVLDGGVFNTGTGLTTINATGSINIGDGITAGTFNANGNVNVNGGSITRTSGSFNLASGRTLTASNDAQIDLGGSTTLFGGTTWNITSGADLFNSGSMGIGTTVGGTAVTVDGTGSSLTTGSSTSTWGQSGGQTAQVTVRNGATANVGDIELARFSPSGATGVIAVESGATMTTGNLFVANSDGATTIGTIMVTGTGSSLTQSGGSTLRLGHAVESTATLNVLDGGTFTAGTGGTVLHATGTINIDGGFANLGPLNLQGGTINFLAGSLAYGGDLTVGTSGLFGPDLTLPATKRLALTGTTTVNSFRTLSLDGGSLSTNSLVVNGNFQFNAGTLNITGAGGTSIGAGGPLGAVVTLAVGQNLAVTNTLAVDSGATLVVGTGANVEAGTLANSGSVVLDGAAATLGGTAVSNSGLLRGEGVVSADVTNNAGGEIRAQAGKTLSLTGASGPNEGRINLQGGTLDIAAALTNAAGGDIVGRGTLATGGLTNAGDIALSNGVTDLFGDVNNETTGGVIVSGHADATFWDDVTHTGALFNVSTGSSATFFGTAGFGVSGGGDVFFEADVTPGSSPGVESFGGNVHFGTLANLEIEIGGTAVGQFDALAIAGGATLGGTLDISLFDLGGGLFAPAAGDSFDILTAAGGVNGTFGQANLPALTPGLAWDLAYGPNKVMLSVARLFSADFDQDGDVDGDDLVEWRGDFDVNDLSDADADGDSDGADFLAWQRQVGSATTLAAAIPEPATLALLVLGMLAMFFRRRVAVS